MIELIPALDLLGNRVVRLTQGDYNQVTVYSDDPVKIAMDFRDAGVSRLHLVDLDGARDGSVFHGQLIARIKKETGLVIEAGGGVRSLSSFEKFLESGLEVNSDFVMIGSLPFHDPQEFSKISRKYAKNVLHTVDVWGRDVRISGWKESTNISIADHLKKMADTGIKNYLVTQIKKDGMMTGPDIELYEELGRQFPGIRVIVSGGISGLSDVDKISHIGNLSGFIVGRAFYENRITLESIRSYQDRKEKNSI